MASCYADPALAERELGWKAAFGLDKMCKGIPSLAQRALPAPCPPSPPLSLFQVRTCGGGSCRTPWASARTELWPGLGCSEPRGLPPSWESSSSSPSCLWHGQEGLEHPQPPPSSSSSPRSLHLTEQNHSREQSRGLVWNPPGNAQGLQPAQAGSSCSSLCPGHPALAQLSPAEPKVQQSPCSLLPHLARGELKAPQPGTSHRDQPHSKATRAHFPSPGLPPPPFSLPPAWFWGPNLISPLPRAVPAWPGCPQPPQCLLGQPLPSSIAKGCPGAGSAPLSHTAPIYSWQLPGLHQAGMTQSAPCAGGWMNNLCS